MTNAKIVDLNRIRQEVIAADLASEPKRMSTPFYSVLFERPEDRPDEGSFSVPAFFADLNCDQFVDVVTTGKEDYDLKPFFHSCLGRAGAITYRHDAMRDLDNASLLEQVNAFARRLREMRECLNQMQKRHYKEQKQAWFLDAVEIYCDAISTFASELPHANPQSIAFVKFGDYLRPYLSSGHFSELFLETKRLKADLSIVKYCVIIKGTSFTVRKYEGESNYSAEVEETFEKFKQGAVKDYRLTFSESNDMNPIEGHILAFVARLYPEIFKALDSYCARHRDYLDQTISTFDREVQFYIAYRELVARLKRAGLHFCYPTISEKSKEVHSCDGFDIVLAHKLTNEGASIVCNDFRLEAGERILVISGPNQGGKTTFARAFGQLHYLASIGCPVPGTSAQLFLFDNLFTHFEREEKVETLRGKLEDDLIRIRDILHEATARSIVIMNEIFTSTTLKDEIFLSKKTMERLVAADLLCVWVTFIDELASSGPHIVSMVSAVLRENPALRTFKIVRRPADGLAYAMAIAKKYRLTYEAIRARIKS